MNYETRYAAYQQAIEGYLAGLFTAVIAALAVL